MGAPATPSVLFICGRNAIRSPMAEAFWRRRFGADAAVLSCGLSPASGPDGFMLSVMQEIGEDLSAFEPREFDECGDWPCDLVISLASGIDQTAAHFAQQKGAAFLAWPVGDPTFADGSREQILDAYRVCRDAVRGHIEAWSG